MGQASRVEPLTVWIPAWRDAPIWGLPTNPFFPYSTLHDLDPCKQARRDDQYDPVTHRTIDKQKWGDWCTS